MKKRFLLTAVIVLTALLTALFLCSCDKEGEGGDVTDTPAETVYCKVIFNVDEVKYAETEVKKGACVYTPSNPIKEGYTFSGWKNGEADFVFTTPIESDLTLTAAFTVRTVTVTFTNKGEDDIVRQVNYGASLTDIPQIPEREDYSAVWSVTNFEKLTADITVYAIYTPLSVTVTFTADGDEVAKKIVFYGGNLTEIPEIPEKEGFEGKWDREDFSELVENLTVTAVYSPISYRVTFVSTPPEYMKVDPFVEEAIYVTGSGFEVTPVPFAILNHTAVWDKTDFSDIAADITVNAVYTPQNVTVTFTGIEGDAKTVTLLCGTALAQEDIPDCADALESEVKDDTRNRNFHWISASAADITAPILDNVSFFVEYDTYVTVKFVLGGGSLNTSELKDGNNEIKCGDTISAPTATLTGYAFTEWTFSDGGSFPYQVPDVNEVTITANWSPLRFKVCLSEIEGVEYTDVTEGSDFPYGGDFSFKISTSKTVLKVVANGVELVANGGLYTLQNLSEDTQIGIKTEDLEVFEVGFSRNDALIFTVRSVTEGSYLRAVPDFSVTENVRVAKWVYGDIDTILDSPIMQDIVLNEYFEYSSYAVTYYGDAYDYYASDNVAYGDSTYRYYTPEGIDGMIFVGWYEDEELSGEPVDDAFIVSQPGAIRLYAKWIEERTITDEAVLGIWKSGDKLLKFEESGKLKLRDGESYRELSFSSENGVLKIMDKVTAIGSGVLTYYGDAYTKVDSAVTVNYGGIIIKTETEGFTLDDDRLDELWSYVDSPKDASEIFELKDKTLSFDFDDLYLRLYLVEASKRKITVSYDADGGVVESLTQIFDMSVNDELFVPTKEGFKFAGWFDAQNVEVNRDYFRTKEKLLSVAVKAKWLSDVVDYSTLPIIGLYTGVYDGVLYAVNFGKDADYGIVTINLSNDTFTENVYVYNYVGEVYFDADSEVVELNAVGINIWLPSLGERKSLSKHSLGTMDNKTYYTGTSDYDIYRLQNGKLILEGMETDVYSDGNVYYYILEGELKKLQISSMKSSAALPSAFVGSWTYSDATETITLVIGADGLVEMDGEKIWLCTVETVPYYAKGGYLEIAGEKLVMRMTGEPSREFSK